eukprot:scaffold79_cov130-Isochrysis_galbana.AAC.2
MQYDGDLKLPTHFLVPPPAITHTSGEYAAKNGLRTFACSETQKFGHVTFFWNGNRSGYFDEKLETYVEIPSDKCIFNTAPKVHPSPAGIWLPPLPSISCASLTPPQRCTLPCRYLASTPPFHFMCFLNTAPKVHPPLPVFGSQ